MGSHGSGSGGPKRGDKGGLWARWGVGGPGGGPGLPCPEICSQRARTAKPAPTGPSWSPHSGPSTRAGPTHVRDPHTCPHACLTTRPGPWGSLGWNTGGHISRGVPVCVDMGSPGTPPLEVTRPLWASLPSSEHWDKSPDLEGSLRGLTEVIRGSSREPGTQDVPRKHEEQAQGDRCTLRAHAHGCTQARSEHKHGRTGATGTGVCRGGHTRVHTGAHVCARGPPGQPPMWFTPFQRFPSPQPPPQLCPGHIWVWPRGPGGLPVFREALVASPRLQHAVPHKVVSVCLTTDIPQPPALPSPLPGA